ncbi:MAG: hypothetical protein U9O97_02875 [Elusimicrobiota bacterium]|nr:hypothetical protein [Elusimicrobiota bacterium]
MRFFFPRYSFARKAAGIVAAAAGVWLFINAAAYVDVTLRARSAYLEGIKYLKWYNSPGVKKKALDLWLAESKSEIISSDDKELLAESLQMQYKLKMEDNDAKNAYYWFKTVIECFQPPRSVYVKRAEEQIVIAEKLWKEAK